MTKFRYKVTVLAAVACVCLTAVNVGEASAATGTSRHWAAEATPINDGVTLTAVSCVSRKYCVGLGTFKYGSNGQERPAAYEWLGSRWTSLSIPADASALAGVACTSSRYCIVVGGNRNSVAQGWTLAGNTWTDRSTYHSSLAILWAVRCSGPTSCEAVGEHGNSSGVYPLAEYWNGYRWTNQSTEGAPTGSLNGVACRSVGHCEAVGSDHSSNTVLAMSLSGSKWLQDTTPTLPAAGVGYELANVSCYTSGCVAVGTSEAGTTVAEAWTGGKWALQSPVGTGDPSASNSTWNSVHCSSASDCVAVGGSASDTGSGLRTLVDTWNGTTWKVDRSPSPSLYGDQLYAVSCTSLVCTAVGNRDVKNIDKSNSLAVVGSVQS
jgi:hypothetical protein